MVVMLIAVAVLMFGTMVWGTGAFHGAVAEALPALERRIDSLGARHAAHGEILDAQWLSAGRGEEDGEVRRELRHDS